MFLVEKNNRWNRSIFFICFSEPPKPPPKPAMRPAATDTRNLIVQKEIACGSNEWKRSCDSSTDTKSLVDHHDRASGVDIPTELLARHVSTDTRTLISTRDNFSVTQAIPQIVHIDAQTQFLPTIQHDASSNTSAPAQLRHCSVQVCRIFVMKSKNNCHFIFVFKAVEEQPIIKHSTTSTELDIFHQLGHLRNSVSNTDVKRSTDRSTVTERQQSRDLAVNTEPKIMYSKDVGDFDVRRNENQSDREFFEQQEITWSTLTGRRQPLHSHTTMRSDQGLQTDLSDTTREVGYLVRPLKSPEETIEEQRQEIITFRIPKQVAPVLEPRTEEIYETTIVTESHPTTCHFEQTKTKTDSFDSTIIKSEMTEWTRSFGQATNLKSSMETNQPLKKRSQSPEDLVEESYEVVSTLTKPNESQFSVTTSRPTSSMTKQYVDLNAAKGASSEDDSSYCEEWTVTEAKRKQDGQTVRTIIDR